MKIKRWLRTKWANVLEFWGLASPFSFYLYHAMVRKYGIKEAQEIVEDGVLIYKNERKEDDIQKYTARAIIEREYSQALTISVSEIYRLQEGGNA